MTTHLARGMFFCGLLLLAGCERPGEGAKAAAGYAACTPVIEALGRFDAEQGRYPELLGHLVPSYLSAVPGEVGGYPLDYRATDAGRGFELAFSYSGPGMNRCRYRPDTGWACSGHF